MANGLSVDVSSRIPTRVGQKRVDIDSNEFKKVDLRKRTNIRSLSKELNVPKSTLHVRIKEGKIRQHSNAIKPDLPEANKRANLEFLEAANRDGLDIRLSCQPPNSHDMNVLDLGFFRAIQSLQYQEAPRTIDELVNAVQKSFDEFPSDSLNHVFLTLQSCMVEVMKVYGGNNYKVPHMGKYQLIRRGVLPSQLECGSEIVENALNHLQQQT
ncbi:hypothetical protein Vadar_005306 [Vaccinium darrowii]|uniref:Uncharacterized protein n=1 Tax=Vaccinium darrowii TaxID=229202 RepID=A0ACB7YJJ6_9ERIC|nr:hypothetical protein Vadar_005306 [Vaccinium darrowii]